MAERENSSFLATENEATPPSAETLVAPQNQDATRVALPNKIRTLIAQSLIAAAPFLASCGDASDSGQPADSQNSGTALPENAEDWQSRLVWLSGYGADWHFEGKFPRDFMLSVYADGELISNKQVNVRDGAFEVSGFAGETTKYINILAHEVPQNDSKYFVSIPIEPKITCPGMVGVSELGNMDNTHANEQKDK